MNEILDNNISLDEELHKYNLVNQPEVSFTSVTTYAEYFFEGFDAKKIATKLVSCLLYTSPSPRDRQKSRMPSSA